MWVLVGEVCVGLWRGWLGCEAVHVLAGLASWPEQAPQVTVPDTLGSPWLGGAETLSLLLGLAVVWVV